MIHKLWITTHDLQALRFKKLENRYKAKMWTEDERQEFSVK